MNHFDFTDCRIVVVGDVMLDKYLSGSVERLSPEAPVPVLLREVERAVLGGGGQRLCQPCRAWGRGRRNWSDRPRRGWISAGRPAQSLSKVEHGTPGH
jgi:hypothetical protein